MKIVVTGGAGFIGSHIVDSLIKNGHRVVIIDNLSTGRLVNVNRQAKFYEIDITSDKLFDIFDVERPDIVSHHAAQMNVRRSTDDPVYDAKTNIIGTINVLEACVRYNVNHFIFSSSGGVIYGEPKSLPAKETDPTLPISPYGIAKLTCEHYIRYYSSTYNMKSTIFRYGNVYGPRQNSAGEAGVVAIFIDLLLQSKSPVIYGNGTQTRDFIYISDIVKANDIVIDKGIDGIFNIGSGIETTINEIYEKLTDILHTHIKPIYYQERTGEVKRICLDSSKFKDLTNYLPKIELKDGLKETCNFFLTKREIS